MGVSHGSVFLALQTIEDLQARGGLPTRRSWRGAGGAGFAVGLLITDAPRRATPRRSRSVSEFSLVPSHTSSSSTAPPRADVRPPVAAQHGKRLVLSRVKQCWRSLRSAGWTFRARAATRPRLAGQRREQSADRGHPARRGLRDLLQPQLMTIADPHVAQMILTYRCDGGGS